MKKGKPLKLTLHNTHYSKRLYMVCLVYLRNFQKDITDRIQSLLHNHYTKCTVEYHIMP